MALTARAIEHVYAAATAFASRALYGVSLRVERGRLTVVLGRSGSGKSTLLRILAGLERPTVGTVSVDGEPIGPANRGEVGLVFQDPESQLFADSVVDDVEFGPRNLGRDALQSRQDAVSALEAVGLDPASFGPRSPFTLSGGEARRAAMAGVLAMRPGYLLLDEPTAGLDASGRRAVRSAVLGVLDMSGAVVVTHDADEWLPYAHEVLLLADGAPTFSGTAADLAAAGCAAFDEAGLRAPELMRLAELAATRGALPAGGPGAWSDVEALAGALLGARGRSS